MKRIEKARGHGPGVTARGLFCTAGKRPREDFTTERR